jgi:hypothetical protein
MLGMNTRCRVFAVDVMAHQQKPLPAFKTLEGGILANTTLPAKLT